MADWVAMAGSALAFVRDSAVAVIPGTTDARDAIARFESAALPMTLAEALDHVLAGSSIAAAPPFFIAVRDDQHWRCALRGAIAVRIDAGEPMTGDAVSSWLEFTTADDSVLEVEVREATPLSWLPIGNGPTRIGALRRGPGSTTDATPHDDDLPGESTVIGGAAAVLDAAQIGHHAALPTDALTGVDHSDVAVSAILCSQHHPNPPERGRCWLCATMLDSRSVVRVARPPLGTVALDDGRTIAIDRTVLLGRNPRAERTDAAHLPALVSVGSEAPGVSRTHARVFLDGWQVLVEDLGSTFGSTLTGADGAQRRLRPGQPELVTGDSVLDLGGGSRVQLLGVP